MGGRRGAVREMSVILLVLGILLSAAGGALIGFGIPIKELSHGTTLILSGAFAVVGGLLLVGLSAVVSELARVTAALKAPQAPAAAARVARAELPSPSAETVAREPAADAIATTETEAAKEIAPESATAVVQEAGKPAEPVVAVAPPAAAVEVSASTIERLRSSIPRAAPEKMVPETTDAVPLSPNGHHGPHHIEPKLPIEPLVPRSVGAAAVETREPRLDFLFRPRQARQAQAAQGNQQGPQQEAFDSVWPRRLGHDDQVEPRRDVPRAPAEPQLQPAARESKPTATHKAAATQERTVAILKSGVVDGMAYTLYADGSIEAQLPQGTVRFGSIAELRAHIENNG